LAESFLYVVELFEPVHKRLSAHSILTGKLVKKGALQKINILLVRQVGFEKAFGMSKEAAKKLASRSASSVP
jgi:hypothetical protein